MAVTLFYSKTQAKNFRSNFGYAVGHSVTLDAGGVERMYTDTPEGEAELNDLRDSFADASTFEVQAIRPVREFGKPVNPETWESWGYSGVVGGKGNPLPLADSPL